MSKLIEIIEKPITGEWGEEDDDGTGIPVLRTTNFTQIGDINFDNVVTRKVGFNKAKSKFLKKGDIIIEKSGGSEKQPVGRVVYFDSCENYYLFNNFTSILRLKESIKNDSKFLFYALFRNYNKGGTIKYQNKTTGIHNINLQRFIESFEIPLPPIEIQQKIAKTLDTAADLLKLRKQQLAELDLLIQSIFYEMFGDPGRNVKGWEIKAICDFSTVRIGPFGSLLHVSDYIENGFPLINPTHIINGTIEPDAKLTLTDEKFAELQSYVMKSNDIVIGRRGEIGRCAVVEKEGYLCGTGSMFIRIKQDYLPIVLQRILSSDTIRKKLENQSVGVTMKNLNSGTISNLEVPMIPLPLQAKFATIVEKIEQQKTLVQQAINEVQTLFDSLMNQYFS